MLEQMRTLQRVLDDLPPRVSRVIARHDVPYGRVFRMWTTRGDMIAYANRGEIADLPRAVPEKPGTVQLLPPAFWGVPVYVE
jgi:hypothetical protein